MVAALRRDVGGREQRIAGQLLRLDAVERERAARRVDVVLDERRLARLLVRRDDEALQQRCCRPRRQSRRGRARPPAGIGQLRGVNACSAASTAPITRRLPGRARRHPSVHVGVARPVDQVGRLNQVLRLAEPGAEREHQEKRGGQQRQMPARGRRHPDRRPNREPRLPDRKYRPRRQRREQDQRLREAAHELEERQREDVEAGVAAQNRIGLPERNRVAPRQPCLPLGGGVERDHDRDDDAPGPTRWRAVAAVRAAAPECLPAW